jgi:general L-amino acid transport system permease protein
MTTATRIAERTPFWRNEKILAVIFQALFVLALILVFWFLINNMSTRLASQGRTLRWTFLGTSAGFAIGEGLPFSPQESYGRAFVVALVNTLRVAGIGIVLATILGIFAGIARLSSNWLLSRLVGVYIEIIRSTPLLVQLFFWYFGVILALPNIDAAREISGLAVVSNRGISLTALRVSAAGEDWLLWLLAAGLAGIGAAWLRRRSLHRDGRVGSGFLVGAAVFLAVTLVGYTVTALTAALPPSTTYTLQRGDRGILYADLDGNGQFDAGADRRLAYVPVELLDEGGQVIGQARTNGSGEYRFFGLPEGSAGVALRWEAPALIVADVPVRQGFNYVGGLHMTPEFAGLLLGLVIYTGAFIAEIVRAGINAVSRGQWEASRALGLKPGQILRMIILPQALRVIVPPMTNQYLNLTKNSSLAIAIGYPDLFNVSLTILNQTGAEVQMFLLIMGTYLSFSLLTSLFMNWYNRRIAIVER